MVQVFKDYKEMIAHIRHKDVEIKHKAVKVEDIKPVEEATPKKAKKTTKKKKKEDK